MTIEAYRAEQEAHLERMRKFLARAAECERAGDFETAEAFGALAANKLAGVVERGRRILDFRKEQT